MSSLTLFGIKARRLLGVTAVFVLFCSSSLFSIDPSFNKSQITYLVQARQLEKAIDLYFLYKKSLGKHDFEVLQQIALLLLQQGARSQDQETQLLSIYGCGVGSVASSLDILEAGVKSAHAETQIASIQFLGRLQDDRSDELLIKAMSSDFFFARMEAAYHLATRKHRSSVGQIESLMYRIPPQARFFFPQFFALIGTSDAISILRHLMEDRFSSVRVEALLSAARFGRDDLLPSIRTCITHVNIAEQEAAAYSLGLLKDSKSIWKIEPLMKASPANVQISAAHALYMLGLSEVKELLLKSAEEGNLFAIVSLADIPEGKDLLAKLCSHSDLAIRINAAIALIQQQDPRSKEALLEILVKDLRDLGFVPQSSIGKTMLSFKPVFSASQQPTTPIDIPAATRALREQLLRETLHLPEKDFIQIAKALFASKQTELISTLVMLLGNLQTEHSLQLLKEKAQEAGMPLVRGYSNLALYQLGVEGPYENYVKEWVKKSKDSAMIRFRPLVPMDQRFNEGTYELTPEDSSRLLVEAYQTIADKHEDANLDILLEALQNGTIKNRHVLAGLLLRALQ